MTIFGYRWVQGYGFEGIPGNIGPFPSYQAAYGAVRRADTRLSRRGLHDWYIRHEGVERRDDGTWYVRRASVAEIG